MKNVLIASATALTLLAGVGAASAQSTVTRETVTTRETVRLTPQQRTTIYKHVRQHPRAAARPLPMKEVEVGMRIPSDVELYDVPDTVVSEVPAARPYRYMIINNEVVLVDPATSQVVEVIRE